MKKIEMLFCKQHSYQNKLDYHHSFIIRLNFFRNFCLQNNILIKTKTDYHHSFKIHYYQHSYQNKNNIVYSYQNITPRRLSADI